MTAGRHLTWASALMLTLCTGCHRAPTERQQTPTIASSVSTSASTSAALPNVRVAGARSLYGLQVALRGEDGKPFALDAHRGHPVLLAMFYASCPRACPMLISDLRSLDAALSPSIRADVRVVLVSFDPEHDDPAALIALRERRKLDPARWSLSVARDDDQARLLAAALDVRYRSEDGGFVHSSVITLIDRDGRIDARAETGADDTRDKLRALAARVEALSEKVPTD